MSSFGFSGTNVHLLLEEAPTNAADGCGRGRVAGPGDFGTAGSALLELAKAYGEWLTDPSLALTDAAIVSTRVGLISVIVWRWSRRP